MAGLEGKNLDRTVRNVEGTQDPSVTKIGWIAVSSSIFNTTTQRVRTSPEHPVLLEADEELFGNTVQLSVGRIEDHPVTIQRTVYSRDGVRENTFTIVEGITHANNSSLYFDTEAKTDPSGWTGHGYYWDLTMGEYTQDSFGPAGRTVTDVDRGVWAIDDAGILLALRGEIERRIEDPEKAARIYATTYLRFNQLQGDSYFNRLAASGLDLPAPKRPVSEVLLVDPALEPVMQAEFEKALAYVRFTGSHLEVDAQLKQAIEAGLASSELQAFTDGFVAGRKELGARHKEVMSSCDSMLDSNYVPAGNANWRQRSWPYMDIGDYDREAQALRAGNFGIVSRELDREITELRYKLDKMLLPRLAVLGALCGSDFVGQSLQINEFSDKITE